MFGRAKIVPKPNTPWWVIGLFFLGIIGIIFGFLLSVPDQDSPIALGFIVIGFLLFITLGIYGFEIAR